MIKVNTEYPEIKISINGNKKDVFLELMTLIEYFMQRNPEFIKDATEAAKDILEVKKGI